MEDPIAIEEQVYQCGCNVTGDNDEQRPFLQAPDCTHRGRAHGRHHWQGSRVKNNDMDQPLNEANAQPVIVVANTST